MKYNEFDNPREKPIVQPQTTMTTKDIGDRVEKAKARAFKKGTFKNVDELIEAQKKLRKMN